MKIALVTGMPPAGACGIWDYTQRLAQALRSLGADAEIISEGRWGLLDVAGIRHTLDKLKPDVIHIQYPTTGFGYRLFPHWLAAKRRCVITLHEASQAHILRRVSLYAFALRPRRLIFTSDYELQFAMRWAPWVSRCSSVIPIGSNIDAIRCGVNRSAQEVTYFGLIMPLKGLEEVLKLAKLLRSSCSELRVRVIGKPHSRHRDYFEELRQKSRGLPIIWNTDLNDEQVAAQLGHTAIGYLPFPDGVSERRGSLRAMLASGVAVVTRRGSHTPANLEGVVKFANGVENGFAVIEQLLNDPEEQQRLRYNAIEYMREFSWEHIANLHLDVYEGVRADLLG
jgi:glycosyltransferase involved in cell wall biosynthesis